jgi:hypothetical protein
MCSLEVAWACSTDVGDAIDPNFAKSSVRHAQSSSPIVRT